MTRRLASEPAKRSADKPLVHLNAPEAWGESADGFLERLIKQVEDREICEWCFMPPTDHRAHCPSETVKGEDL